MNSASFQIMLAMSAYLLVTVFIGFYFARRANQNAHSYFLGGRSLGPWVTAMSAEASDMSGWLLMGLPGVAYWCGLADAVWTSIGLAIGTYINWLVVAKRLRNYSALAGDAITIPEFFSRRFKEEKKIILTISAVFSLVFFSVYTASCFVTCGKLFATLFGGSYISMMLLGAFIVVLYTFMGGFLAVSTSDFFQGVIMIFALVTIFIAGTVNAGGLGAVMDNIRQIPGFFTFFGIASPQMADGAQQVVNGAAQFGNPVPYGTLTIVSTLSWGLGYFGMPQVLVRFMAIRDAGELKFSRRIATVWCCISLVAALFIGFIGRAMYPTNLLTPSAAENIFIVMATNLLPPLLAGVVMAGILAATMSSADSYLLVAASALAKDIYHSLLHREASEKQVMVVSRLTLLAVSVFGVILALDETSVIFKVVSFAWAGFGATFGPSMLFSLFWKRTTRQGIIAGMLCGGISVFIWKMLIRPMGGAWDIYELFPAFVISVVVIVAVSLLTPAPKDDILEEFEQARQGVGVKA